MADPARTIDAVEVYWRPGCPFCRPLRRGLDRAGVRTREINIHDAPPEAAARVRAAANGNETVPTVFIGEHALVAPRVGEVLAVVDQVAPHLRPSTSGPTRESLLLRVLTALRRKGQSRA